VPAGRWRQRLGVIGADQAQPMPYLPIVLGRLRCPGERRHGTADWSRLPYDCWSGSRTDWVPRRSKGVNRGGCSTSTSQTARPNDRGWKWETCRQSARSPLGKPPAALSITSGHSVNSRDRRTQPDPAAAARLQQDSIQLAPKTIFFLIPFSIGVGGASTPIRPLLRRQVKLPRSKNPGNRSVFYPNCFWDEFVR